MAGKLDFTEQEWEDLRKGATGAGLLVSVSDRSFFDTFKEANAGGKYDTIIANAQKFLKSIQQGGPEDGMAYGGFGYDGKSRPDTSNTHFTVEALLAAGLPKDDPAIKNALLFLSKCQNLPGEANKTEYAKKATDDDKGGFVYNPFAATDPKGKKDDSIYRYDRAGLLMALKSAGAGRGK